ncbi:MULTISPECIES: hypothetical protein [unclassified Anabaena]|nr:MULTISPECIES: hypothetical protein [unclassified Anabaena]
MSFQRFFTILLKELPKNQKEKAINYMNDYIKRNQKGGYYEEN